LAWAWSHDATRLDLVVEDAAGLLTRRAAEFAEPAGVWWLNDRRLHAVEPEPLLPSLPPPPEALALAPVLEAAGAEVVIEHGVVAGEILGLEIARVVVDHGPPTTDTAGRARIEVGVGRHDREAFAMVHGDLPTEAALAAVIATVRQRRTGTADAHPLKRLAPERWLREIVVAHPDLAGAATLERIEATVPRVSLKQPFPAAAAGLDGDGNPVVVVCSVGVDLDLVPTAADIRLAFDPVARLVLVVPERDDLPITGALADALVRPAEIVTVPGNWRTTAVP
jgi:hypothetical protein